MDNLLSNPLIKLDFQPNIKWPEFWPTFFWGDYQITGFDRLNPREHFLDLKKNTINRSNNSTLQSLDDLAGIEECFKSCYPKITLSELARLYHLLESQEEEVFNFSRLCRLYNYHWSLSLEKVLLSLYKTPAAFQNWASDKDLQPRDLEPLLCEGAKLLDGRVYERLAELNPTKSNGILMFEWLVELRELDHCNEILLGLSDEGAQPWFNNLKILRYPQTTQRDCANSLFVKQLTWPKQVTSQWKRQGDRAKISIEFTISSPEDFKKKLQQFNQTLIELETKNPWLMSD